MLKELCGRFYSLLKKEAAHENEPQRILFLLRNIMLLLGLYFLIFPLVMCLVSPRTRGWIGYVFAVLAALIFFGTYRLRVRTGVVMCVTLQLAWVVIFILMYGWDCGIQHLMFEMLVLVYFAIYNGVGYKIGYTAFLFAVRFVLFVYCRRNQPYYGLTENATVVLQIMNMILSFVLMGVVCAMFSSNVESAEKKLVQVIGTAMFPGDIAPDLPSLSGGTLTVFGQERRIERGCKNRNPDGSVNYCSLEVV